MGQGLALFAARRAQGRRPLGFREAVGCSNRPSAPSSTSPSPARRSRKRSISASSSATCSSRSASTDESWTTCGRPSGSPAGRRRAAAGLGQPYMSIYFWARATPSGAIDGPAGARGRRAQATALRSTARPRLGQSTTRGATIGEAGLPRSSVAVLEGDSSWPTVRAWPASPPSSPACSPDLVLSPSSGGSRRPRPGQEALRHRRGVDHPFSLVWRASRRASPPSHRESSRARSRRSSEAWTLARRGVHQRSFAIVLGTLGWRTRLAGSAHEAMPRSREAVEPPVSRSATPLGSSARARRSAGRADRGGGADSRGAPSTWPGEHKRARPRGLGSPAPRRNRRAPRSPRCGAAGGHYRQALALADELGMRPLVAHCHLGLGKLYRRTGKRRAGPRAPHHRDDDVPRDGYAVLSGAGGGGDGFRQADSGSDGWPVNGRTARIDRRKPPTGRETMAE